MCFQNLTNFIREASNWSIRLTGKIKKENTEILSNIREKIIVNTDVDTVNTPVKIVETSKPGIEYVHVALNIQTTKRYHAPTRLI